MAINLSLTLEPNRARIRARCRRLYRLCGDPLQRGSIARAARGAAKEFSLINQQHDCAVPHLSLLGAITSRHRIGNIPGSARLGSARRSRSRARLCSSSLIEVTSLAHVAGLWGIFRKAAITGLSDTKIRRGKIEKRPAATSSCESFTLLLRGVALSLLQSTLRAFVAEKLPLFEPWSLMLDPFH